MSEEKEEKKPKKAKEIYSGPNPAYAALRTAGKVGAGILITGAVGMGAILLFASIYTGVPGGMHTVIDGNDGVSKITLKTIDGKDVASDNGVGYLSASEKYLNARPTTTQKVMSWVESWQDEPMVPQDEDERCDVHMMTNPRTGTDSSGSLEDDGYVYAYAFSFILENVSDKTAYYNYSVVMDTFSYNRDKKAAGEFVLPYEYLRIVIFENEITDGAATHNRTFYGKANNNDVGFCNGTDFIDDENRECISGGARNSYTMYGDKNYRTCDYTDEVSGAQLCEPFGETVNDLIPASSEKTMQVGQKYRYTLLAYLEGTDPDCVGGAPLDVSFSFSIHFGTSDYMDE